MQKYETIATFTLPSEMIVAKTKLESEGIECRVLDELTVQSYNFLSNAVGGVKLQVPVDDFDRAYSILQEGGFVKEHKYEPNFIERKLGDPAFYKKFKLLNVVLFGTAVLATIGVVIFGIIQRPSTYERLISEKWCLDHIVYENETYIPNTIVNEFSVRLVFPGNCYEVIEFYSNSNVNIPGFSSRTITGKWTLENKQIRLFDIDTLDFVFEGVFDVKISNTQFILSSETTQMFCVKSYN